MVTRKTKHNSYENVLLMSGMQEKILRELATYKYLTVSQLVKLKVGVKNRIYENLTKLEDAGLVKYADYKALLRYGKQLERIHFLTPKGANLLVTNTPNSHLDHIRYPKSSTTLFTHDYFHRVSSINTQISFYNWLCNHKMQLITYANYFDVVGSRKNHVTDPMHAVTRIEFGNGHFLDPDGIGIYENNEQTKVTLIETYNGKNTKRVIEQLRKHIYVIKHGLASIKYNLEAPTRVCCTFENENAIKAVLKRLQNDPYFQFNNIEYYFFFGVAEQVWEDFENSFVNLKGEFTKMSNLQPANP
jgi:hypothetical protein